MLGGIFIATRLDFLIRLPLSGVVGAPGEVDGGMEKAEVRVLKPGPSNDFTVEGSESASDFESSTELAWDMDCEEDTVAGDGGWLAPGEGRRETLLVRCWGIAGVVARPGPEACRHSLLLSFWNPRKVKDPYEVEGTRLPDREALWTPILLRSRLSIAQPHQTNLRIFEHARIDVSTQIRRDDTYSLRQREVIVYGVELQRGYGRFSSGM
jgi:hypothetical protein